MSLASVSAADGRLRVLAIDHRDSLRAFISPTDPDSVPREHVVDLKRELLRAVGPMASAVMLEPEYSIPELVPEVPVGVGFFAALEAQGYLADPGAAPTSLFWHADDAVRCGASVAKLLLPYHPDHQLAGEQRRVGAEVVAECRRAGIPIVLEPLFFGLADPSDRARVVLETAVTFASIGPNGPDLLKLPFPVDPNLVTEHHERVAACRRITEACRQPWAILSGGGDFDSFERQVSDALEGGANGFMVGRALWGEAARASAVERRDVIERIVLPRWRRLLDASR